MPVIRRDTILELVVQSSCTKNKIIDRTLTCHRAVGVPLDLPVLVAQLLGKQSEWQEKQNKERHEPYQHEFLVLCKLAANNFDLLWFLIATNLLWALT